MVTHCPTNAWVITARVAEQETTQATGQSGIVMPDCQSGANGRRSVCVQRLYDNPHGTMKPVAQTVEGVSVPRKN